MATRRITVYLIQRKRRMKGGAVAYYLLRWRGPDGKEVSDSLGRCSDLTKAAAKAARAQMEDDVNGGRGPAPKSGGLTLGQFRDIYKRDRSRGEEPDAQRLTKEYPRLAARSIAGHDMVLRYSLAFFGADCQLADIDMLGAERWAAALASGELIAAGGKGQLSRNSVRTYARMAQAIFGWAVHHGLIRSNPFACLLGTLERTEPNPHITREVFRQVIDPDHEVYGPPRARPSSAWRVMLGLCRLAGLRRGEALALRWCDVDWKGERLALQIGKTGRRAVPIVPELMPLLLEAHEQAPEGAERVVEPISENNARRKLLLLLKAAGVAPWWKLFQSLRSSCENDWKVAGFAEPTYCAWLGHSPEVSREAYVAPTDAEFRAASGGAA